VSITKTEKEASRKGTRNKENIKEPLESIGFRRAGRQEFRVCRGHRGPPRGKIVRGTARARNPEGAGGYRFDQAKARGCGDGDGGGGGRGGEGE
jgi:hypothetical protein